VHPFLLPALTAILGAALALLIARLVFMRRLAESRGQAAGEAAAAEARAADAHRRAEELARTVADLHRQLSDARAAHAALERDRHWLTEESERHRQALGSTQALLESAQRTLRDSFQSVAAEALHTNRAAFLDMARSSFEALQKEATTQIETRHKAFDSLVAPIAERLAHVDARLEEAERERLQAYTRLMEQVSALGSTADTLSRALRTPAVRGRWGEMQLRRVIEIAGMLHRCDFDEQRGLFSENGRIRPDVLVHLPGGKQIVIDAKAPLEAFLDAQECRDDEGRALKLQAHARHVREHMDKLGSKAYWEPLDASLEMVVMFLPGETLFSTALQYDLTLIEHGLAQRVLIASPITLIALLTTIAHTWRQEALAENYREVAGLGRELYDRLARYTDYLDDLRKKLDGAVQAYNQAAGSFESRVLVSARRLRDLDVTTAPELPPAQPIDTVPRVLKQVGLMGLPEEATQDPDEA
jgi:DNA recombination protein RmuC